jgi:hypothetical protein
LAAVKHFSQLPMLVDFVSSSFGFEIWYAYNSLKDNALVKNSWENTNW